MRRSHLFLCRGMPIFHAAIVLVGLFSAVFVSPASAALRAGAAAVNITADKPDRPVHDPLFAKVLVLEDGGQHAILISVDLIGVQPPLLKDVREGIGKEFGVDSSCVLINASHNHDTFDQVAVDAAARIVGGVRKAVESLAPAKIAAGAGREDRVAMNRRIHLKDGRHWTIRRATPSLADAELADLGPFDPTIGLLRVDSIEGKPIALLYTYACHNYGGVPGGGVTGGIPAFASRVIESAWPGAVALFFQGAAGDVTPTRYKDFDAPIQNIELGTMLGLSTLEAAQALAPRTQSGIRVLAETLDLPRRADLAQKIQDLLAEQQKILEFYSGAGCGAHGAGTSLNSKSYFPLMMKYAIDPEFPINAPFAYKQDELTGRNDLRQLDVENKKRLDVYRQCLEKMDRLITIRTNIQLMQQQLDRGETGPVRAEVRALRVGDFVLVTFPGEPFAQIGLNVRKQSPYANTFLAGYTNGHIGYAPTTADYAAEPAYEDSLTRLAPAWQEIFEKKVAEMLERLR